MGKEKSNDAITYRFEKENSLKIFFCSFIIFYYIIVLVQLTDQQLDGQDQTMDHGLKLRHVSKQHKQGTLQF